MKRLSRRTAAALALAAALIVGLSLQVLAIHDHSLSGDGAYHLVAGHQALRYGQNTTNLEHPPLAKLVMALPLFLENEPLTPPLEVSTALRTSNEVYGQGELVWRGTVRGRWLVFLVFVLPMLAATYLLGRQYGSPLTGALLVLLMLFSLSSLPYLTLLQTDAAVTLAFLGTILAATAYVRSPSPGWAMAVGAAAGFGLAVKFSALLLGPMVLLAFAVAPGPRRKRLGHLLGAAFLVVTVVEVAYLAANSDYDSALGREVIRTYCENKGTLAVADEMRAWESTLLAVERIDPRLAQWLTGFAGVQIQNAMGVYPSYAFGEVRSEGRWWYFPAVLALKTPLVLLLVAAIALLGFFRTRAWQDEAWRRPEIVLPATVLLVYLVTSLTSNYNLSVRHLLPILPLLYLPLAAWLSRRPRWAATVVTVLLVESLVLSPLWMSATNTWWLGEKNPTRFSLSAGNLEYRQNFRQLAKEVAERDLEPFFVLYPALPDEILVPDLPNAQMRRPGDPLDPGWYAVNVTVEQMVPALLQASADEVYGYDELVTAARTWEPFWQEVARGEDHGWIAGTFHLYELR